MSATRLHESLEKQPSVDQNFGPLALSNHRMMERRDKKTLRWGRRPFQQCHGHLPCQRVSYDISILISHFKLKAEGHLESEWFFVISSCQVCFLVTYFFDSNFSSADKYSQSHWNHAVVDRGFFPGLRMPVHPLRMVHS